MTCVQSLSTSFVCIMIKSIVHIFSQLYKSISETNKLKITEWTDIILAAHMTGI